MSKPWLEDWRFEWANHNAVLKPPTEAHGRLAAAAPALVRALLAVEWTGAAGDCGGEAMNGVLLAAARMALRWRLATEWRLHGVEWARGPLPTEPFAWWHA